MKRAVVFLALLILPLTAEEILCIEDAFQAEFSGNDKIVFARPSSGKAVVYDFSARRCQELAFSGNSFVSLDAEKIFFCGEGIFPQLFLLDVKSGKTVEIETSEPPSGAIFRVKNSIWAFPSGYDKVPKLQFLDITSMKGGKTFPLPAGTVNVSGDGRYAAIQFDNGTCNIKVVEPATGKTVFITNCVSGSMQKNGCHSPVFSPDSSKLLYVAGDIQPLADIMMYDFEKKQLTRMTSDGRDNQRPRWSPDGKRFLHSTLRDGKYCTAVQKL